METRLKFNFDGMVTLREDYENPRNIRYYAVLDGSMGAQDCLEETRVRDLSITLGKEKYDELKKALADSGSESPFLKFKGELEVSVESACFN